MPDTLEVSPALLRKHLKRRRTAPAHLANGQRFANCKFGRIRMHPRVLTNANSGHTRRAMETPKKSDPAPDSEAADSPSAEPASDNILRTDQHVSPYSAEDKKVSTDASDAVKTAKPEKKESSTFAFAIKLFLVIFVLRSFVYSFFTIPSESMLPTLANGDYLIAAKWPYGFSRYSLPFSVPLIPGRIFASAPDRGDVVIFKHPVDHSDYIKRVIALPGDSVGLENGQLIINGKPVKTEDSKPFKIAVSPNTSCAWGAQVESFAEGGQACVYKQEREDLPGGKNHMTLDFGQTAQDNFPAVIVPEGQMFVMGDNRDNSQDSRFPAVPGGGVGIVPQELLVGRAEVILWSTDGSAEWLLPWTWFTAARWERIGTRL